MVAKKEVIRAFHFSPFAGYTKEILVILKSISVNLFLNSEFQPSYNAQFLTYNCFYFLLNLLNIAFCCYLSPILPYFPVSKPISIFPLNVHTILRSPSPVYYVVLLVQEIYSFRTSFIVILLDILLCVWFFVNNIKEKGAYYSSSS